MLAVVEFSRNFSSDDICGALLWKHQSSPIFWRFHEVARNFQHVLATSKQPQAGSSNF
jgi:hypothetical protein